MTFQSLVVMAGLLIGVSALGPWIPKVAAESAGTAQPATSAQDATEGLDEQVQELREMVTDPEGAIQTAVADVRKMKRVQLSGYVQVRYDSFAGAPVPSGYQLNTFSVRRARLKVAARPTHHTGITLQADFGGTSVTLKDAFVEWFPLAAEPGQSWVVSAGQMKWPFGYQVVQSSSVRETPERAQVLQRLFPGERDRGVLLTSPSEQRLWGQFGLFNGTGANTVDNNTSKDWVGRVRYAALPNLDLGASFYVGRSLSQPGTPATGPTIGFVDSNGNGIRDPGEPEVVIPGSPAKPGRSTDKTRYGVDAEWWPVEGVSIKGEYVAGKEFVKTTTVAGRETTVRGWWVQGTYSLSPRTTGVVMYDTYNDGSPENSLSIWHLGVVHHLTDATRAKLFYQIVGERIGQGRSNNGIVGELISTF